MRCNASAHAPTFRFDSFFKVWETGCLWSPLNSGLGVENIPSDRVKGQQVGRESIFRRFMG